MNLDDKYIKSRKRVGTLRGEPVMNVTTYGGLNLYVCKKSGKMETLAAAPHPAIARHIAQIKEPEIELSELSKSEWVDPASLQTFVPKYLAWTERVNQMTDLMGL